MKKTFRLNTGIIVSDPKFLDFRTIRFNNFLVPTFVCIAPLCECLQYSEQYLLQDARSRRSTRP